MVQIKCKSTSRDTLEFDWTVKKNEYIYNIKTNKTSEQCEAKWEKKKPTILKCMKKGQTTF